MKDVDAVLSLAEEQVDAIRALYNASLLDQTIPESLPARIKNVLENQRSALDYLAYDIAQRYGKGGDRVYYPMATNEKDYDGRIDNDMPGVRASRSDITDEIKKHQPYNQPWLHSLQALGRPNKHRHLTPQTRTEDPRWVMRDPSGGEVSWSASGVQFSGNVVIGGEAVDPRTGRPPSAKPVIYVDWLFEDPNVPVLSTLDEIQSHVRTCVSSIATVAGL
jgi:hypothetical protein